MKRFLATIKKLKLSIAIAISMLVFMGYSVFAWATKPKEVPSDSGNATVTDASPLDASPLDASMMDAMLDPEDYPGKMKRPMEYEKHKKYKPLSPYYTYVDKKPLTTTYPYVEADEDYFEDALFIGDSRIEGLYYYGNIEGADFCYLEGATAFNIFEEWMQWGDDGSGSLKKRLDKRRYKKIYIMLGVNELGNGYATDYASKYNDLIEYIHKKQKKAVVIVMSTMYMTREYSDDSDVFNTDNVDCRNSLVSEYIDGEMTFYLDVNTAVTDKSGALDPELTNDGVHLSADKYTILVDYIKSHAIQDSFWD